MFKKLLIATGVFAVSMITAGGVVLAQTQTITPTSIQTTVTPSPTTTIPGGAPATGKAR